MTADQKPFSLSFNSARFLQSASKLSNCPADKGVEVAFAGRSNAGKSSAINAITRNGKLARTSKTPGRTQLINFFSTNHPDVRLVDLPGYGFAKVSLDLKAEWGKHLEDYLQNRESLRGLVLIMDIRKPLTEFDHMLLDWSHQCHLPTLVILTKSDKLKRGAANEAFFKVRKELEFHESLEGIIQLSSLKKTGVSEADAALNKLIHQQWLSSLESSEA